MFLFFCAKKTKQNGRKLFWTDYCSFFPNQARYIQYKPQINHHRKDFAETPIALCISHFLFCKSGQKTTRAKSIQRPKKYTKNEPKPNWYFSN